MKSTLTLLSLLLASTLFVGCSLSLTPNARIPQPATPSIPVVPPKVKPIVPSKKAPHHSNKKHKMKKVEDKNYSDTYMYPEDNSSAKKDPIKVNPSTPAPTTTASMTKEECISMIGEEKFTKYTQMLGSEASSIKRCSMLKAMK